MSTYNQLLKLSRSSALLQSVHYLLDWDQETYMPQEAIGMRSEQSEMIASLVHKKKTSKKFATALSSLMDLKTGHIHDNKLSKEQIAALKRWRRDYLQEIKLPGVFVKQFAKTTSTASHVWQSAKKNNNFKEFVPHLQKVVSLCRKKADLLGFAEHPYDALLDLFEPEMTIDQLDPLFTHLKEALTSILKEIEQKPAVKQDFLYKHCDSHKQMEFAHIILKKMGFDSASSRLDLSAHPFCTEMNPLDVRMTTKVDPNNLMFCLGAVLHEAGHGLYSKNLPIEHFGSPLGEAVSLGIHESQSRFWETVIGQSLPFWQYFFPLLQKVFPEQLGQIDLQDFYWAINSVKPGLIRIDSDEVSYNLHIIVRFEIEKALIEGSLRIQEIPEMWNSKMQSYLGICPSNDAQGCLQDIHWSLGHIGYFPTYTLGNLYSAQFFEAFEKSHPEWENKLTEGDLAFVANYLKENIHQYGRQFSSAELCQRITGKNLSHEPYIHYLSKKYDALYCLK